MKFEGWRVGDGINDPGMWLCFYPNNDTPFRVHSSAGPNILPHIYQALVAKLIHGL